MLDTLLLAIQGLPEVTPDPDGLPGADTANGMVGGLMIYGLIFCIVGVILSAGLWAIGSFSSNYTQSVNGKKGFLICAGAAIAIGAARMLVNWFADTGTKAGAEDNALGA